MSSSVFNNRYIDAFIVTTLMFCFIVFQNKLPSPFFASGNRPKDRLTSAEMQSSTEGMLCSL